MRVLVACEYLGIVRDAFIAKGHDAISCDLLPTEKPGPHYQGDVRNLLLLEHFDLMIAHPPCTFLTLAGNKWFKPEFADRFPNRQAQREAAIEFVLMLASQNVPRIAIENPIGVLNSQWRKPNQIVHPFHFGEPVSKSTALWLKGLEPLQHTNVVEPKWYQPAKGKRFSQWHYDTGHLDRSAWSKLRSKTFDGIAQAMADQWGGP